MAITEATDAKLVALIVGQGDGGSGGRGLQGGGVVPTGAIGHVSQLVAGVGECAAPMDAGSMLTG